MDIDLTLSQSGARSGNARSRRAYFVSVGWAEVPAFEFRDLAIGKQVKGPAIVESPFTSIAQADCGNALPTTYMGAAKDVYAEG